MTRAQRLARARSRGYAAYMRGGTEPCGYHRDAMVAAWHQGWRDAERAAERALLPRPVVPPRVLVPEGVTAPQPPVVQ